MQNVIVVVQVVAVAVVNCEECNSSSTLQHNVVVVIVFVDCPVFSRPGVDSKRKSARQLEKANNNPDDDIEVLDNLACLFFFEVDTKWSKVRINGKRWPDGMKTSEKLSLSEGEFVKIKCGPKYDTIHDDEFLLQGDENAIGKTVREICKRRDNGLNVSQVDAHKIFEEMVTSKQLKAIDNDHVPLTLEERQKKSQNCKKKLQYLTTMKFLMIRRLNVNFSTIFLIIPKTN